MNSTRKEDVVSYVDRLLQDIDAFMQRKGVGAKDDVDVFVPHADQSEAFVTYRGVYFSTWDGADVLYYETGALPELAELLRRVHPQGAMRTLQFISEWMDALPGSIDAVDAADRFAECAVGEASLARSL